MQMAFESAADERSWAKRGRHPRKKDGSGPVITATDAPPVVALDRFAGHQDPNPRRREEYRLSALHR